MKNCPFCAEEIQDEAIKCRHCGSLLNQPPPAPPVSQPSTGSASAPRDEFEDIRELARQGKTIEAIKLLREKTGLGLKEAKAFVDNPIGGLPATTSKKSVWTETRGVGRRGFSLLAVGVGFLLTLVSSTTAGFGIFLLWVGLAFLIRGGPVARVLGGLVLASILGSVGMSMGGNTLAAPAPSAGASSGSPASTTAAKAAARPVVTDGSAFEDICENWFFYRDRTLRLAQAGDEEGAAKARKQFEQNGRWLSDYPGRTLPATKSGCR